MTRDNLKQKQWQCSYALTLTVTITSVDNRVDAPDKTVTVSGVASNAVGVTGPAAVTLIITDDDTASWTVTVAPASIAEDGGTSTVKVSTGGVTFLSDRSIALSLAGTAIRDIDYTIDAERLTLPAGSSTVTTTVTALQDTVVEGDETVVVTASHGGSTVGTTQTITITDDDTASWTVTVEPASIAEANGTATVEVSTGGVTFLTDQSIALSLSGTATKGTDYDIGSVSLTLAAGNNSVSTMVTAKQDTVVEPDETVVVTASHGGSTASATITITDDDTVSWALAVEPASIAEANGTATVEVSTGGVTFLTDQAIALSLSGTATQGDDYTTAAESLTLPAGETSVTMTVTAVPDAVDEADETVVVTVSHGESSVDNQVDAPDKTVTVSGVTSNAAGVTGPAPVTLTINDDDTAGVTVSKTSVTMAEGADETYTVALTSEPTASVSVAPKSDATAVATMSSETLIFTATNWSTAQMVTVSGVDNDIVIAAARTTLVSHTVTSADTNYSGITVAGVSVTVTEDDTVPGAPAAPVLAPGHRQVAASWSAPGDDGGRPITGYTVQWKEASVQIWPTPTPDSSADVPGTSYILTGLTNDTEYAVRVRAVNALGDGAWSEPATATPFNDGAVLYRRLSQSILPRVGLAMMDGTMWAVEKRVEALGTAQALDWCKPNMVYKLNPDVTQSWRR